MKKILLLLTLMLTAPTWAQSVTPPNQGRTTSTRPSISANFNARVNKPRVWVDGVDYSRWAQVKGGRVSVVPPSPLKYGAHQVKVLTNGQQKAWTFYVVADNKNNNGNNGNNNGNNGRGNNGKNNDHRDNDHRDNDHRDNDWNNNGKNNGNNGQYNGNYNNGNNGNYNGQNNGYANRVVDVSRYGPPAGSVVTVRRPSVSAAFSGPVQNLRLMVDGRDVTREATTGNEGISWTPRSDLGRGQHTANVTGNAQNGQAVSGDWNFVVQY